MIIKELIIDDENEELGVYAVSLVSRPAIETTFEYFNKQESIKMGRRQQKAQEAGVNLEDWWVYTAAPDSEVLPTSHKFCKQKAGNVFHVSEIQGWGSLNASLQEEYKFITNSNFFASFDGTNPNKNVDQQIFGCRHYFKRVRNIDEIPAYKLEIFKTPDENTELESQKIVLKAMEDENFKFSSQKIFLKVSNAEKHEISGVALRSGQFIYRNNIDNQGEGYCYFSRDTIRKIKQKYGYNRTITLEHSLNPELNEVWENATGTCILLDSWLVEDEEKNMTEWFLKYKVVDDKLWELIKNETLVGFSVEAIFKIK